MGKCSAHQLEKWNFCAEFQTFCAGEHCRFFKEEPPMTNADHIRAMSDEELAQLLVRLASCVDDMECGGCPFENSGAVCWMAEGIEKWLEQPYKENTDDKT